MRRPREPAPGDCCGSGCTRCVWDMYYDELAKFEEFIANGGEEEEASVSSEDDTPISYVGSVVVKYLGATELSDRSAYTFSDFEKEEVKLRNLVPIEKVNLIKSSESVFDPNTPGVNIIDVHAPFSGVRPMPGDTVEILVPNSTGTNAGDDVARLCKALGLDPNTWCELRRSPFVPEDNFPPWLPLEVPITVGHLFSFYIDVSSSSYLLHRSFFEGLLRIYNNSKAMSKSSDLAPSTRDREKVQLLKECASTDKGAEVLRTMANTAAPLCYPSLADVLEAFSFVKVPLDRLLEVTGPLQPRKFSVTNYIPSNAAVDHIQLCMREVCAPRSRNLNASAVSGSPRRVAEMLNEASYGVSSDSSEFFFGHTSHPLCNAARTSQKGALTLPRKMYVGSSLFGRTYFAKQLHAGCSLVCDPSRAKNLRSMVFFVGCGTGIAPLIAAVSQLMYLRASSSGDDAPYPCWVFYGARTEAELVYHEKLESALSTGAITHYECALSRVQEKGQNRSHVTDLLKKHQTAVVNALENAGQMFVCGPASALRAVRKVLECDLLAEADDDDSVREQRIFMLEKQGRLLFDNWSTGSIF
ncbi:oxidoreductase-like protein [Leptomonas pyrrhocoris]|uniref:Oxidoreductase-like protein n=1 Tax=Leptomonas pyrrhocoris TaxID=157538 RepID=A0A0M9G621_LEPPY|nr:oxidoreductase-like protein [Leptomonas pyrrhocoris]XP_015661389.1 oxidoreductase-like protein [Leptomonas pyrrhocoris]KPA82949.1 oxidoreductase-like protein [Leptomonas pyrrhocoris]KPA82950.1 oxidoreductase-like protein [Leptomonas pyrrhocoris]|eukprot:XP_015661388.1 oxidoreductase-like protein [Leptomonas pyrrhocoris]